MKNLITIINLETNSRKKVLILFSSFIFGIVIPVIPYLINFIANERTKKEIELNNKKLIIKLEENCKSKNSRYAKLLNLGFQKFALEEFNNCMREKLKGQS